MTLLGIRSTVKDDLQFSPVETLYWTALTLPDQMFEQTNSFNEDINEYMKRLEKGLCEIPYFSSKLQDVKSFLPYVIKLCSNVFAYNNPTYSLIYKYTGTFKVLSKMKQLLCVSMVKMKLTLYIE